MPGLRAGAMPPRIAGREPLLALLQAYPKCIAS